MSQSDSAVCVGVIAEQERLTLAQLCVLCDAPHGQILELVQEGVLEATSSTEPRFEGSALRRARLAVRLQRDLGVNTAGVALVIDLLEHMAVLRRDLGR